MRHRVEGRKFGREKAHRTALFRNLVRSLIDSKEGRIETTEAKAKEIRSQVDRLITYAKKDTVAARRLAYSVLGNRTLVKKLFDEVAPLLKDRNGGYTRIYKTGFRKGDSAPLAILELVSAPEREDEHKEDKKAAKKAKPAKKAKETKHTEKEETPQLEKKPRARKKAAQADDVGAAEQQDIKAKDLLKDKNTKAEDKE